MSLSVPMFKLYIFFSEDRFVLANSVEPDEMPHHLRLRCFLKLSFRSH